MTTAEDHAREVVKVGITVSVNVHPDLPPDLFVCDTGAVLASVRTPDMRGHLSLHADSADAMLGWLRSVAVAVESTMAPVLPLDDVFSTHPAEVAG